MEIISTILGFLPIRSIYDHLMRPRLEIYYDPDETYHKARDQAFNEILGSFAHVMVRNKGKTMAKNCIAELRSIEVSEGGSFTRVPEYRNIMVLKWAHEKDFSPKDIDVDSPKRLDVCYVHEGIDIVHFFTEKYPSGNQTDFLPGTYQITIRVRGDNCRNAEEQFIVKYEAGKFESLQIEDA